MCEHIYLENFKIIVKIHIKCFSVVYIKKFICGSIGMQLNAGCLIFTKEGIKLF